MTFRDFIHNFYRCALTYSRIEKIQSKIKFPLNLDKEQMENGYKFNILLNSTKKVYLSYYFIFELSKKLLSKIKIVSKTIMLFLCFCPISFYHISHYEET